MIFFKSLIIILTIFILLFQPKLEFINNYYIQSLYIIMVLIISCFDTVFASCLTIFFIILLLTQKYLSKHKLCKKTQKKKTTNPQKKNYQDHAKLMDKPTEENHIPIDIIPDHSSSTTTCNNHYEDPILKSFHTDEKKLNDIQNNVFDKFNAKVQYNELGANSMNMQGMYEDIDGYEKKQFDL